MKIGKNHIIDALKTVQDPLTGRDLVSSQRLGRLEIDGLQISCVLVFNKALEPHQKSALNFACIEAVQRRFPAAQLHIHLETDLSQGGTRSVLPQVKNIIAVASGKGGVGKSTVSTNLALGLQSLGAHVGLLDADLYGPSIPTMLNLKGAKPKVQDVYGKPKLLPLEAYGLKVMSIGFIIEPEQAVVLRGPRLAGIIKQFIQDCLWPPLDFLVIDLPPGTGDIQLTLVQTVPVTGAIMVTTPQQVAVADARKAMNMFLMPSIKVPILGVVENMSWFTPPDLPDRRYYLFGQGGGELLARESETKLIGQIPMEEAVMQGGEAGVPAVLRDEHAPMQKVWLDLASATQSLVEERNRQLDPTEIVRIKT